LKESKVTPSNGAYETELDTLKLSYMGQRVMAWHASKKKLKDGASADYKEKVKEVRRCGEGEGGGGGGGGGDSAAATLFTTNVALPTARFVPRSYTLWTQIPRLPGG